MKGDAQQMQKTLELMNRVNSELENMIGSVALQLHNEYLKSDGFKGHLIDGLEIGLGHFRALARTRISNDLRIGSVILSQEGTIPPKSVFYGKEDILRMAMTVDDGTKEMVWGLEHGFAQVCIHLHSTAEFDHPVNPEEFIKDFLDRGGRSKDELDS